MDIKFRDDAISKNRLVLRITFIWALVSSCSLLVVTVMSFHAFKHQKMLWLPVCSPTDFSISETDYSPGYLKEMAKKVIDLRLTYNPETIESHYKMLANLTMSNYQEQINRLLSHEIASVKKKSISSVFYTDKVSVDTKHHEALVSGFLHRTSHGLALEPSYRQYKLSFAFKNGELSPISIIEVKNEKA
ncbi:conjugative transfer protein TraE [Legionella busanensis]|uniref:Conjugative transfer protein TraE n=1 Tax=Legionella busanensis TaxID=190655 RepID=A0A378KCB0_9GAMM|nr:TraE/TraK family type IV conjugative transfer system protein [Legionella busanensis]STX81255.1 conjugative transfer protein TraE [Legionella busanensis]